LGVSAPTKRNARIICLALRVNVGKRSPYLENDDTYEKRGLLTDTYYYRCCGGPQVYNGKLIYFKEDRVRPCCENSVCNKYGWCILTKDYVPAGEHCHNHDECKDNLPCIENKCTECTKPAECKTGFTCIDKTCVRKRVTGANVLKRVTAKMV